MNNTKHEMKGKKCDKNEKTNSIIKTSYSCYHVLTYSVPFFIKQAKHINHFILKAKSSPFRCCLSTSLRAWCSSASQLSPTFLRLFYYWHVVVSPSRVSEGNRRPQRDPLVINFSRLTTGWQYMSCKINELTFLYKAGHYSFNTCFSL